MPTPMPITLTSGLLKVDGARNLYPLHKQWRDGAGPMMTTETSPSYIYQLAYNYAEGCRMPLARDLRQQNRNMRTSFRENVHFCKTSPIAFSCVVSLNGGGLYLEG
jgi:hypothetical protein